jgi:hypothetical protein
LLISLFFFFFFFLLLFYFPPPPPPGQGYSNEKKIRGDPRRNMLVLHFPTVSIIYPDLPPDPDEKIRDTNKERISKCDWNISVPLPPCYGLYLLSSCLSPQQVLSEKQEKQNWKRKLSDVKVYPPPPFFLGTYRTKNQI